jgi:hypothetical protein
VAWIATPALGRQKTPPAERSEEHWGWLLWLALGIFGLQYTIQEIPAETLSARGQVFTLGLASIVALSVFAWRQWQKDRPLIDYRGLLNWRYLLGIGLYFSGYFMAGTSGFLLPILFREGLGLSLAGTALIVSLSLLCSVAAALLHAAWARRKPRLRLFMLCGLTLYATACLLFSQLRHAGDWHWLLLPAVLCGCAIPFFLGPVAFGTFVELPAKVFSHGYQVKNIVRQLGLSSSIALSTVALQFFYNRQLGALPARSQPDWSEVLHGLAGSAGGLGSPLVQASAEVFFLLALLTLPVAAVTLAQRTFR